MKNMKQILLGALIISSTTIISIHARAEVQPEPTPAPLTNIVQNDEKENLLADSYSRTLYVFDPDEGTNTSVCVGDCAEVWPPYIVSANEANGLSAPLGTVKRANGKLQLTHDGHPLYTYDLDRVIGADAGDGIGGVWHYIEIKN